MPKLLLVCLLFVAHGCDANTKQKKNQNQNNTTQNQNSNIKVYFSKTSGAFYKDGADNIIIQSINEATNSIYLAMYNFTNKNIKQAIIDAKNRGLDVKIVTDKKYKNIAVFKKFKDIGIIVIDDDDQTKSMHNKILIIDEHIVYIGSANYTVYAFYRNYENIIKIKDKNIAKIYKDKLDNLFAKNGKTTNSHKSKTIDIYFSPEHNIEDVIIQHINNSKNSIKVLAFALTNSSISDSLIAASNRGVQVSVVFDKEQNNYQKYSKYDNLVSNGISAVLNNNAKKMHNKVMIFDDNIVLSGSYNFTNQANDKNDENVVLIKNKTIVKKYKDEFKKIYDR